MRVNGSMGPIVPTPPCGNFLYTNGYIISMSTTRISEEARTAIKEKADQKDKSMAEVVDDLVDSHLDVGGDEAGSTEGSTEADESEDGEQAQGVDDSGDVIGHCQGCGYQFTEEDRNSRLIAADDVVCPVSSCVEHDRKRPIKQLPDEPPEHIEKPTTATEVEHAQGQKVKTESD